MTTAASQRAEGGHGEDDVVEVDTGAGNGVWGRGGVVEGTLGKGGEDGLGGGDVDRVHREVPEGDWMTGAGRDGIEGDGGLGVRGRGGHGDSEGRGG